MIARCPARYSCITVFQDYVFLIHFSRACCFGYAKIGTRLGMQAAADTRYCVWISTYNADHYQKAIILLGPLLSADQVRKIWRVWSMPARFRTLPFG